MNDIKGTPKVLGADGALIWRADSIRLGRLSLGPLFPVESPPTLFDFPLPGDRIGVCAMILDKRQRALICASFFCFAAALGDGARAAQVYPGCAQPGATGKVWYVDPVNGKTPAAGGDGSQTAPWNSLHGILSFRFPSGYTRPLLSSVPYFHVVDGKRVYVADQLGSPPVQPGDTIELMSGNYGDIGIGDYLQQVVNPSFVTVEAAPGQAPVFTTLFIRSTNKWVFKGIKVQSLLGTNNNQQALVSVTDQGASLPTSDIILESMQISSADDTDGWTKPEWLARVRVFGIFARGNDHGADTTCVSVTNSHISKIIFGAEIWANNMLFSGNEIDRFGDDGIDYVASNILISKNYIHDDLDLGNGAHMDGMQGYPGSSSNVVIDSNRVIRQTDPKLPFPTYLQGIDAFDGDWTNITVTNNVVVTSACWGIYLASVHGGKIINNTVADDGLLPMPGNCRPGVAVGDKTHEGSSSNDVIIRNNIATGLSIYNPDPNMTMDHNICLGINGKCQIVTYVNGKPNWGVFKPGMYGDHNIIDRRGADGVFVGFDPAKFLYDLRLRSGAGATGAGNSAEAPPVDIAGTRRGSRIDVGAYQYSPDK
jgi:parallel beta-helix repeat protein